MGAFKFRGAYNSLCQLSDDEKKKGVVTYSFGNHSQAIALSAQLLGIKATIFMPEDASPAKIAGTKGYGGNVVFYDRHKIEGQVLVAELAQKSGMTIIPPYNHKDVIAGQGTVATELIEEVGELDYLFVCVGGGGLISGMSVAVKELSPNCKIYGVEPEAGNDAQMSFQKGEIVQIPGPQSIADGALTTALGDLTFALIRRNVEDMLTVTDPQLLDCMHFFGERMKLMIEPTGCLGLAGLLHGGIDVRGKKVGVVISGGNVEMKRYAQLITEAIENKKVAGDC